MWKGSRHGAHGTAHKVARTSRHSLVSPPPVVRYTHTHTHTHTHKDKQAASQALSVWGGLDALSLRLDTLSDWWALWHALLHTAFCVTASAAPLNAFRCRSLKHVAYMYKSAYIAAYSSGVIYIYTYIYMCVCVCCCLTVYVYVYVYIYTLIPASIYLYI